MEIIVPITFFSECNIQSIILLVVGLLQLNHLLVNWEAALIFELLQIIVSPSNHVIIFYTHSTSNIFWQWSDISGICSSLEILLTDWPWFFRERCFTWITAFVITIGLLALFLNEFLEISLPPTAEGSYLQKISINFLPCKCSFNAWSRVAVVQWSKACL
jgi:hypothetical protein